MKVIIDQIRLQLPAAFEHRAESIARRLSDELARLPWLESATVSQAIIPARTVLPEWSDQQIARHLALAVKDQITRQRG
jgi:hypothetical protein